MSEELIVKVKQMIIDSLRIEGMSPDEIGSDAPLFGDGLGLDSIDALQLVVAMEKEFGTVVPDLPLSAAWRPLFPKTANEHVCSPTKSIATIGKMRR